MTLCYDYNGFEVRLKLKGDLAERYELDKEYKKLCRMYACEVLGLSTHAKEDNALEYIKTTCVYDYLLTKGIEIVYCDRYEPIVELIDMYKVIHDENTKIN